MLGHWWKWKSQGDITGSLVAMEGHRVTLWGLVPAVRSMTSNSLFFLSPLFQSVDSIAQALSSQNVSYVRQAALPFGAPLLMTPGVMDVSLLYQPTHVTAYSSARHLPLWVSASVTPSMVPPPPPPALICLLTLAAVDLCFHLIVSGGPRLPPNLPTWPCSILLSVAAPASPPGRAPSYCQWRPPPPPPTSPPGRAQCFSVTSATLGFCYIDHSGFLLLHWPLWVSVITSATLHFCFIDHSGFLLYGPLWVSVTLATLGFCYMGHSGFLLHRPLWVSATSTTMSGNLFLICSFSAGRSGCLLLSLRQW